MQNTNSKYVEQIAQDLRNAVKHDKRSTTKLAATFGITDLNLIKELTELAISIVARELAHQPNTSTQQRFNNIVSLYQIQANLSHRTSNSILFQQYSTPAPIGYIMGVFCGIDKGNVHLFEPSAGNGLLTIAGNKRFTVVNELDQVRYQNLLSQDFLKVTQLDASKPFPYLYQKNYPAVITNPPFGRTDDVMFNGVAIGELDHVMALRALDCMEDSGRAAIIIGGHTDYDAEGRIQAGKNRKFLTYLYQHYNVLDIIPIDGHKLYSRQGTSFNTRLILIDGRKETPGGFPPLNTKGKDDVVSSFDELFKRVMQYVKQDGIIKSGEFTFLKNNPMQQAKAIAALKKYINDGSKVIPLYQYIENIEPIHEVKTTKIHSSKSDKGYVERITVGNHVLRYKAEADYYEYLKNGGYPYSDYLVDLDAKNNLLKIEQEREREAQRIKQQEEDKIYYQNKLKFIKSLINADFDTELSKINKQYIQKYNAANTDQEKSRYKMYIEQNENALEKQYFIANNLYEVSKDTAIPKYNWQTRDEVLVNFMAKEPIRTKIIEVRDNQDGSTTYKVEKTEGIVNQYVGYDLLFPLPTSIKTTPKKNTAMSIAKAKAKAIKIKLNLSTGELGMPYLPASDACNKLDVDVPDSMGFETHQALERIKAQIGGDVDDFVRIKLGYQTKLELCKALAAEQIDAVAMAIYNIEQLNQGIIIGDQTGIGKGRQAAAMIRYAHVQGMRPIFITEKPNLFSDIYRDLVAIGSGDLKPYIVNANDVKTKVKNEDGAVVYEPLDTATQKKIIASAQLPIDYNYVMLTYSQISDSEFNKKTGALISLSPKAFFISKLAQGNILIMDESHNASGDSNTGKVLRDLVEQTKGVVFLSATFAKRADNMPIYALKTAMQEANMTKEVLIDAIEKGGVALQEVLAAQLVQQGQMLRRERTFEGIEVNYITLTEQEQEHRAISDNITAILRDIISFQAKYVMPVVKQLSKIAAKEQGEVELRAGTGKASVDASPYFSKIFNVVNQMLFAIKAESVANHAIQRLREGKKPVIAFSSTMGSFIESLTDDFGMNVDDGAKINADFASVLHNGLQGVLRYTVKDFEGKSTFKSFDITELDAEAQAVYITIQDKINNAVSGIVISPIDLIKQKIEDAGFTVAEVTGRKYEVQLREMQTNEVMPERKAKTSDIPTDAAKVIPPMQMAAIRPLLKGEEAEFFVKKLSDIDKSAKALKKRSIEKEARAWGNIKGNTGSYYNEAALPTFHYFNGSSDIFVYEWDEKEKAFYTYTILNGDTQNSEFGWQSIDELFKNYGFGRSFELDMYYKAKPINEVLDGLNGLGKVSTDKDNPNTAKKYVGLIRPRKKENVFDAFNKFNNNEVDVLLINQSGSTGASAHAIATKKVPASQVKQRVMIVLQAELDINREVQKRGRVNRTGQLIKPIYDYISSAIPAEKRLMMMLQKKLKSLDANTTSNQRNSEDLMKSDDFLNIYGDRVVTEYLTENLDLNEALDDVLKLGKSETDNGKSAPVDPEISSKASGRIAVMDTTTQDNFYTTVLARYNKYVDMLKAQDEYNLEVETMNLQAKTMDKTVVIVGKGGRSPFGDNTILEKCEVNILKKPYTATDVDNILSNTLNGLTAKDYQLNLSNRANNHFEAKLQQELADNESYYDLKIASIVKEKKYETLLDNPIAAQQYINERTQEFNEARRDKATLIQQTNANQKTALSAWFDYFYPGKMLYYPSDFESVNGGNTLAVFLGFEIDENRRNPFAPSAIEARIAIASSKKYIPYPLSRNMELNSIIGASRNINVRAWEFGGRSAWEQAISDNTKDRGTRYILTGNVLQAFGWPSLSKPKLISFTTHDNKVRKGILLSEDWSNKNTDGTESDKYTIVPIAKAKKVVRSMTVGASMISESGLTIARLSLDTFRLTVTRSVKSGGNIFLDADLLKLVDGNNFNTISGVMVANISIDNIDAVCDILQTKHSISVRLLGWQVDIIKDEITSNQFSDEIIPLPPVIKQITQANPNVMVVTTNTKPNLIIAKAKAKAIKIKLQLLNDGSNLHEKGFGMAKVSKEGYERKREYAGKRMKENAAIDTLTSEQHEALSNLASVRHELHSNKHSAIISDEYGYTSKLLSVNEEINESGLTPMSFIGFKSEGDYIDIDTISLLFETEDVPDQADNPKEYQNWYDQNYERISNELEKLNTKIEKYLADIDKKHGTNYAPGGHTRLY